MNKDNIITVVGAAIGLIIGIATGVGMEEGALRILICAWVGIGIGGNLLIFFPKLWQEIVNSLKIGEARSELRKDNLTTTFIWVTIKGLGMLAFYGITGPIIPICRIIFGRL